ncbi:M48 family metalloprotease [bacterium]|nr:M48 family metalloprotease [bacterium]
MNKTLIVILLIMLSFPAYAGRARFNKTGKEFTENDTIAEIRFGRNLAARILGKYKLWDNQKASDYVRIVGTGLISNLGRTDLRFIFAVLDTQDINAYAIPGGYIIITRGALEAMDNEAQLAGVLAHEIAHINQRHIVNRLKIRGDSNAFLSSISIAAAGGAVSGMKVVNEMIDEAVDILFESGIEKKFEISADVEAIQMLVAVGYDWKDYTNYLKKLDQLIYKKQQEIVSKTHPSVEERLDKINFAANESGIMDYSGKKHQKRFHEYIK